MNTEPTEFRRWREALGLTQEAAARQLGTSGRAIQKWEAGVTVPPDSVRKLMTAAARGIELAPWPMSTAHLRGQARRRKRA